METKNRIIIKLICITILIALIVSIMIHARGMSADKCVVKFITTYKQGAIASPSKIEVKVLDLYDSIKQNKCIIKWDDTRGYFLDG